MKRQLLNEANPLILAPRQVLPFAPLRHDERLHYLKLLQSQYKKFNYDNDISRSIEKEYDIAKTSKSKMEYMNNIKRYMYQLLKEGEQKTPVKGETSKKQKIETQLTIFDKLNGLCIPKETLKRHQFVMEVPEPEKYPDMIECAHCRIMFSISKEYARDSQPKAKTRCKFHPGKIKVTLNSSLKKYNKEYANRYYICCNEIPGSSEGCQSLSKHVFKLNSPSYLQYRKPFNLISELPDIMDALYDPSSPAVGLDCEMCYTSKGFELMKLSIVSFPDANLILDEIVKPEGEVIDLNSHVSGVNSIPDDAMTFNEVMALLAQITDIDTVIIGHGLENDLNVLRIIYPKIVDTAILYSENTVDPRRKDSLKQLAWRFLSKNIQAAEHDSTEDAIIPMKIVLQRLNVKPKVGM
ncbi:hypothetical protein CANARDRAFT_201241 [[Candida] arabinofermentans NRRL YB-2248]|uniref:RNA exonuclease 3 n=1 Tax=[Candida] arabinofermentans NRRL YB-2248 TaxID=983967 RepID=A0A1E4SXX6_9ASCO|nr:hypothetical protein CANARDRAFT_201241 [[Candida] arabinofermentans NRRL YB-2248]